MLLELINVSRIYDMVAHKVTSLDNVSFSVARGEFVAIMGASGSGKSTLLNILGCLHKPTSGTYLIEQDDISNLSEKELSQIRNEKIGFVFQTFNLLPRITALRNVEIPLIYQGMSKKKREPKAKKLLESVGLADRTRHCPFELSGGQQQRVAIARALVGSPSILLADEPTGNLDNKSSKEIMKLFASLHNKGMTILMVTHEDNIAEYGNRVIKISDGKIVSDVSYP